MNWGHKLTAGMILFMAFISIMVFKMIKSKVDLVSDNYYETGIAYQNKVESARNGTTIKDQITVYYSDSSQVLTIVIPEIDNGKVLIYRPSEKKDDFQVVLTSINRIDLKSKSKGLWKAKLNWEFNHVKYSIEKEFYVKPEAIVQANI